MGERASRKAAAPKIEKAEKPGTTLVAFRCPDDLLAKIDKAGARTDVVLAALERMFSGSTDEQARQLVRDVARRLGVKIADL